jgi:SPP1 gp7 family putative phage head morphogenesis protein
MARAEDILRGIRGRKQRVTRQLVYQRLLGLADRYQIKFRNVLRTAVRIGQAVSIEKLAAAIRTGNEAAIMAAIPWDDRAEPALRAVLPPLTQELATAAARVAERLLPGDLAYRFDITNPLSVKEALDHSSQLVTEIGEETRAGLRLAIANAIQVGQPPLAAARAIRGQVGLRSDQVAALAKLREAGASDAQLARAATRKLREREVLITRTETMWAANEGQRMLWEQGQEAGVISATAQREYVVTPDDRLCPICEPLDGKLYGVDEQITTELGTVDSPPIHPNCRCTMSLVTTG